MCCNYLHNYLKKKGGEYTCESYRAAALPQKKKTDFVGMRIWNVLCDLPFSLNQPLKSADDQYTGIL